MPSVVPVAKSSDSNTDLSQIWETLESPEYDGYFALINPDTGKLLTARTKNEASFQGLYSIFGYVHMKPLPGLFMKENV